MKNYRAVLWALALIGLCADQAAKYSVFAWLTGADKHRQWLMQVGPETGFALETRYDEIQEIKGVYVPHVNQGALFGLGREHQTAANWGFAFVSFLAAAAIVYWSFKPGAARDLWVCMALGLILAGTLGNLFDRVVFNGVRDFLHWNYLFDWPVFNVADSCLVCGAGLLLLQAFGRQAALKKEEEEAVPAAATSSSPTQAPVSCMGVTPAHKV
jgi:signal peptidase II